MANVVPNKKFIKWEQGGEITAVNIDRIDYIKIKDNTVDIYFSSGDSLIDTSVEVDKLLEMLGL